MTTQSTVVVEPERLGSNLYLAHYTSDGLVSHEQVEDIVSRLREQMEMRMEEVRLTLESFVDRYQRKGLSEDGTFFALPGLTVEVLLRTSAQQGAFDSETVETVPLDTRVEMVEQVQGGARRAGEPLVFHYRDSRVTD